MKYEDLPQTIKVCELVLRRSKEENASCVYYNTENDVEKDGVHAHICYSREGLDFCGFLTVRSGEESAVLFESLGGHRDRYKARRGRHCYEQIELLVKCMEKAVEGYLAALLRATGGAS